MAISASEGHLLPISALQHLLFCERQCALIHLEGLWAENRLTAEGRLLHKKVHDADDERRDGTSMVRGLQLSSQRLGLYGIADMVEFHDGAPPKPIEYKHGRPKKYSADTVQLCAQALCLEEMLGQHVPEGAVFYGKTRRRLVVVFDTKLRAATEAAARRLHTLIRSGVTPKAQREPKCDRCSLQSLCMPDVLGPRATASRYFQATVAELLAGRQGDERP
jgi:CRISPR-associated exonuclease Cas4